MCSNNVKTTSYITDMALELHKMALADKKNTLLALLLKMAVQEGRDILKKSYKNECSS